MELSRPKFLSIDSHFVTATLLVTELLIDSYLVTATLLVTELATLPRAD